jgi:hypothetical protein
MGAIQFIENLDRTTLTISDAEFESNVENAVSAIAERHGEEVPLSAHHSVSEIPLWQEAETMARNSTNSLGSLGESSGSSVAGKGLQDTIPVTGLLRTIQKPLNNMTRIFSEDRSTSPHPNVGETPDAPSASNFLPSTGLSPAVFQPPQNRLDKATTSEGISGTPHVINAPDRDLGIDVNLPIKTSSEMAQIERIERDEHEDVVE